ncbi:MAG: hypothetical protein WCH34_02005, partial [Bacteroidota bacterium]
TSHTTVRTGLVYSGSLRCGATPLSGIYKKYDAAKTNLQFGIEYRIICNYHQYTNLSLPASIRPVRFNFELFD